MRDGVCKHFNGMQNKICDDGVCYRDVTPDPDRLQGSGLRLPCRTTPWANSSAGQLAEFEKRGTCEKFEEPTAEDIAAHDEAVRAIIHRMALAAPLIDRIKTEHKGKAWQGVVECPACKGRLHLSHSSYNGHVHGRCETEGCMSWME